MKKIHIVLATVMVTLAVEAVLFKLWPLSHLLAHYADPQLALRDQLVLNEDVVIVGSTNELLGKLPAGQVLYYPCSHDLVVGEPFHSHHYKIYVEFSDWDEHYHTKYVDELPERTFVRQRAFVKSRKQVDGP